MLGLAAPLLLHLLYGQKFLGAVLPLRLLLLAGLFINSARVLYQVYNATGRPELVTMIEAVGTLVGCCLMLVMVPREGIAGAAISVLLAGILRLACTLAVMQRLFGVHLPMKRRILGQSLEP